MLRMMFFATCMVVLASFTTARAALLIHYDFEEGSGTTAADSAGGDNDGTFTATPVWTTSAAPVPGGSNSAVRIAAMTDTLSTPDDDDLDALPAYTAAMWIKDTPDGFVGANRRNYPRFVEKLDSSDKGMVSHAKVDGKHVQVWHDWPSGDTLDYAAESQVGLDGWHHWAVVFDSTLGSENLKLYIDGELADSSNFANIATANSDSFDVASSSVLANTGMANFIDDFRFYNEALSQGEVQKLVPEPGSLLLLLVGALSVLAIRRGK